MVRGLRLGHFVITACLALGSLIAFGGIGASLQLERARGQHPDEAVEGVRAVLRHPDRVRADHAVLVAVRPEGRPPGCCRARRW
jgi:hypothetical protein